MSSSLWSPRAIAKTDGMSEPTRRPPIASEPQAGAPSPRGSDGGDEARRRYHHGDLREALLTEAEAVLGERGLAGFSLRAVARRAGVSHAAPAHHFGDARGLLTALAARGFERLTAAQRARREAVAAEDELIASGLGYVDFALADPVLFGLIFDAPRLDWEDAALGEAAHAAFAQLTRDTRRTRPDGAVDEAASIEDLRLAWSVVHGLSGLLIGGHLPTMAAMPAAEREAAIVAMLRRLRR